MSSFNFNISKDYRSKILANLKEDEKRALTAVGMQVESWAKVKCPVDTGNLRNSITNEVVDNERAVYIGSAVEYGPHVELGTVRQKAQPFLKPAVTEHKSDIEQIIKTYLKEG